MSVYTTTVRSMCEYFAGKEESAGLRDTAQVISEALPNIFRFDFPIFDSNYRRTLETKILRHYYFREIGFETIGLFIDRLDVKLNEIMPYYNQLYNSILTKFNPAYEVDLYKEGHKKDDGTEKNTGNVQTDDTVTPTGKQITERTPSGKQIVDNTPSGMYIDHRDDTNTRTDELTHKNLFSDTPQGGVTGLDSDTYLTNYTKDLNTGTQTHRTVGDSTRTYQNYKETQETRYDEYKETQETRYDNFKTTGKNVRTDNLLKKIDNINDYTEHVFGIQSGSNYLAMITSFRELILNIDMMIIDDLSDLFMNIY